MEKLYSKLNLSLELEQNKHINKTTEKIRADYVGAPPASIGTYLGQVGAERGGIPIFSYFSYFWPFELKS